MWTGNQFEIDIEFIRHGKTVSNEQKKYISYTDESLSEAGIREIKDKAKGGYYGCAQKVFVSALKRTSETADIIFPDAKQIIIPEINEISFGEFEGKDYNELKENNDYRAWLDSGGITKIPGGESREEFVKRQLLGLNKILLAAKDKDCISVVCHGGTVMALVDSFTDFGYYDIMISSGEKVGCHLCFEIKGNDNVSISHFSFTYRDNT